MIGSPATNHQSGLPAVIKYLPAACLPHVLILFKYFPSIFLFSSSAAWQAGPQLTRGQWRGIIDRVEKFQNFSQFSARCRHCVNYQHHGGESLLTHHLPGQEYHHQPALSPPPLSWASHLDEKLLSTCSDQTTGTWDCEHSLFLLS